jgi:hypothetical protein
MNVVPRHEKSRDGTGAHEARNVSAQAFVNMQP